MQIIGIYDLKHSFTHVGATVQNYTVIKTLKKKIFVKIILGIIERRSLLPEQEVSGAQFQRAARKVDKRGAHFRAQFLKLQGLVKYLFTNCFIEIFLYFICKSVIFNVPARLVSIDHPAPHQKASEISDRWHKYRQTKQQRQTCLCLRESWPSSGYALH